MKTDTFRQGKMPRSGNAMWEISQDCQRRKSCASTCSSQRWQSPARGRISTTSGQGQAVRHTSRRRCRAPPRQEKHKRLPSPWGTLQTWQTCNTKRFYASRGPSPPHGPGQQQYEGLMTMPRTSLHTHTHTNKQTNKRDSCSA